MTTNLAADHLNRDHMLASLQGAVATALKRTIYALSNDKYVQARGPENCKSLARVSAELALLLETFGWCFHVPGQELDGERARAWIQELYRCLELHADILQEPGAGRCMYVAHKDLMLAHFSEDTGATATESPRS